MLRIERRLQIHFAVLTVLGGLLIGNGDGTESLSAIAFTAALFSLIFVDLLEVIYLPAMVAYFFMGLATIYCVGGFFSGVDDRQLAAVARLLVLVQATLHFQKKNRRVFEQLGVFSLLELIVAAVLNDALVFGLLLVPFSAVGLSAMVLLQAYASGMPFVGARGESMINIRNDEALESLEDASPWISKVGLLVLGPAVVAFAFVFFYALPRSAGSGDTGGTGDGLGRAATGYSDHVRLKQMGKLLQNPEMVMRLELTDKQTGEAYVLKDMAYLRGQVLDAYRWNRAEDVAGWQTVRRREFVSQQRLPFEYSEETLARRRGYDRVVASLRVEPLNTNTIFAIPPYYQEKRERKVQHWARQWLLRRRISYQGESRTRLEYSFGTHAFKDGVQSPWIRYVDLASERSYPNRMGNRERYALLAMNRSQMPNLVRIADQVAEETNRRSGNAVDVAVALEQYLAANPDFKYTLDLTMTRDLQVDPIEDFITNHKSGHCQYYAAALALMLRSQGIPARLVVGYKSDEYNGFGKYYIIRQLHAHAWVEAYFDRSQLPQDVNLFGQAPGGGVWRRLDPTPQAGRQEQIGSVSHMMDLAQVLWDDYVLDMNNDRQGGTLKDLGQGVGDIPAYKLLVMRMELFVSRLREGRLGGGSLAMNQLVSWMVGGLAVVLGLSFLVVRKFGSLRALFSRAPVSSTDVWSEEGTSVEYYDRMCSLLSRVGLQRERPQTPVEFAAISERQLGKTVESQSHLQRVVGLFYRSRYGGAQGLDANEQADVERSIASVEQAVEERQNLRMKS